MDNSPRFDEEPRRPAGLAELDLCGRVLSRPIAHVDFSCQMALFYQSLARIARGLGRAKAEGEWTQKDRVLRRTIRETLYHPGEGFYFDRYTDGAWQKVKTVAGFWPLLAGVSDPTEAKRLVEALRDPNVFGTPLPGPSVAVNEPGFSLNYWRGPVWINTTFMTVLGLIRYGYEKDARALAERAYVGVKGEWERSGYLWEMYDPFGGPSARLEKKRFGPLENARHFAGWSALVLPLYLFDPLPEFLERFLKE